MNIPVNIPVFNGNEKKYLNKCIDTGWVSSDGSFVKKFEDDMAAFVGRNYAISVCNGTAALETAVAALNIENGNEVILPDFTIISCAQAIVKAGLVPVPVDCDPFTWNMDETRIEEKITSKTKAIMVVHIYGLPCNMEKIIGLANKYSLYIIEDAAEAHGLIYDNKMCGSFGDVSIFSFYPNKHIVCGEGGMVLTDSSVIANRAKKIRNLFFDYERRYIHEEIGSNFRMTNMQAAIGLAQLEKINETIVKKREIGSVYLKGLEDLKNVIQLPLELVERAQNVFWVFGVVLRDKNYSADLIMDELKKRGIGTRHFFYPIHKQPALIKMGYFEGEDDNSYSNSINLSNKGFYLPSGVGLNKEQQKYVIDGVHDVFLGLGD